MTNLTPRCLSRVLVAALLSTVAYRAPAATGIAFGYSSSGGTEVLSVYTPRAIAGEVKDISGGLSHTAFVKTDGTLWTTGTNGWGELGDGTTVERSIPQQVATDVSKVSVGASHTMFIKTDGTLWGMGYNANGELGDGSNIAHLFPVQCPGVTGVIAVSAGYAFTLFIKSDGTLWAMGKNDFGQLITSNTNNAFTPVQVATGVTGCSASLDSAASYFIKSDGTLWAVGQNTYGMLGDGTGVDRLSPVQVAMGVASVRAGGFHTMFVKTDGSLWGMGRNSVGELGDGTLIDRALPTQIATGVMAVSAGGVNTAFIKSDGTLWTMGSNLEGALGNLALTSPTNSTPIKVASGVAKVAVGASCLMFVEADGTLRASGSQRNGELGDGSSAVDSLILATDVVSVGAGRPAMNLFVKSDGTLWQTNGAQSSQVIGVNRVVDIIVGDYLVQRFFLKDDHTLWEIGIDNTVKQFAADVVSASAGLSYVVYLKSDATLWGKGGDALLKVGDGTHPAQIADHVISISAGCWHLLYVKDDHTLWGMGTPWEGFVPNGGDARNASTPVQLESGVASAVANAAQNLYIKTDGSLWTRGEGWAGNTGPAVQVDTDVVAAAALGTGALYLKADGILRYRTGNRGILGQTVEVAGNVSSVRAAPDSWAVYIQTAGSGTTPVITSQPQPKAVVMGSTATLQVATSGSLPQDFEWFKDGTAISWARSASYVIPYLTAEDTGSYTVVVTNSAGQVTSNAATVSFPQSPAIATSPVDQSISASASATFSVAATGLPTPDYQWQREISGQFGFVDVANDATFSGAKTATLTVNGAAVALNGDQYRCVVTNGFGASVISNPATLKVSSTDYTGAYFGSMSSAGSKWSLYVYADNTAVFIAYLADRHSAVVTHLTVGPAGDFTVNGTEIVPQSTRGSLKALAVGSESSAVRPLAAAQNFTLTGQIFSNRTITGNLSGSGVTFSGALDIYSGSGSPLAGVYTASALGTAGGTTYSIVGGSGKAVVLAAMDTMIDSAAGSVGAGGSFTATTTNGASFAFTVIGSSHSVAATLTAAGSPTSVNFAGLADTILATKRLINLSSRAYGSAGDKVTIAGFVIVGSAPKRVLLRAVGPTLITYGIPPAEAMVDPSIELHDANHQNSVIAVVDNWNDNANPADITTLSAQLGAGAFASDDLKSAAVILTLQPGVYSFVVRGKSDAGGIAILEVYDADGQTSASTLANISTRAYCTAGNGVSIGGFVVSGNAPKHLLIRAVGPTLSTLGVGEKETLQDPTIKVYDAVHGNVKIASNDNWGDNANAAAIVATAARVGATPLASNDIKSSALLLTVEPGVYSFIVESKTVASGIVLLEVYDAD